MAGDWTNAPAPWKVFHAEGSAETQNFSRLIK
jgi:hypothetical protein